MKTNKERANIILRRATNQRLNENVSKQKAPIVWWKWVTVAACSVVGILALSLGLYFGLKEKMPSEMYIANYDKYVAFGSGYINSNVSNMSTSSNKNDECYLLGQTANGELEKIEFTSKKNGGKTINPKGFLSKIVSFKNFTFLGYNKSKYQYPNIPDFLSPKYASDTFGNYVVDNRTGKVYNLNRFDYDIIRFHDNYYLLESEDSVYFFSSKDNSGHYLLYRMYVINEKLKIEEVISQEILDFNIEGTFVDRYNNIYLSKDRLVPDEGFVRYAKVEHLISNGKIQNLKEELLRSLNGVVYTKDKNYSLNETGELVSNSFLQCDVQLDPATIVKKVDNIEYYYGLPIYNYTENSYNSSLQYINKITWENDVEFTCEKITAEGVDGNINKYVTTRDRVYFYSNESVFYVDIETGKRTELNSDYIFTGIESDNLGNVIFYGLANDMSNITGIITNEGDITILRSERKYVVYYLKPIN